MSQLQVIKPTFITDSTFVSSTAPESDYSAWNSGTSYAVGDYCIRTSTHRIYYCLVANTNKTPESNLTGTLPYWLDAAPTNRWACFDSQNSTKTVLASPLTIVINPGIVNSMALMSISGTLAHITQVKDGVTVYDRYVALDGTIIFDWYSYFFEPFSSETPWTLVDVVLNDIPPYGGQITVTITGRTISLGSLIVGSIYSIGDVLYGASFGITSYSVKNTDAFGATTFVKRANSKHLSFPLLLDNSSLAYYYKLLSDLESVPCVWIGSIETSLHNVLTPLGFYKDFVVTIPYPFYSTCTLEIEGLI